ncbi:MAG: hypothetical protein ACTHM8_08990 [Sphingomonas sp.]
MKKLLFALPAAAAFLTGSMVIPTQPAKAVPDCATQIRIRCMGYSFNGKPPITGYDSVEECVAAEVPMQCPPSFAANDPVGKLAAKFEHHTVAPRAIG